MVKTEKLIALTFDDGPNTGTTMDILDKLEKYDVKASFFLVGKDIREETIPVIQREISLGCEIGNHSKTHSFMNKLSKEEIREEVGTTSEKIKDITGKEPQFFRPPYIEINDLMYQVIDMPFICGVNAQDWLPEVSPEERARRILEQSVDGAIVLLHDFPGNANTVEALDTIIPQLKSRGFEFVTVSEMFQRKGVPIRKKPGTIHSVVKKNPE